MHSIQNQFTGALAKQKGGSSSFTHRAAGHLARLAVLLTLAGNLPVAQAQEPYQTQAGRACIDAWTRHVSERLNSYNGTREHNGRKPWSINQYGLFVGQKNAFRLRTRQLGTARLQPLSVDVGDLLQRGQIPRLEKSKL